MSLIIRPCEFSDLDALQKLYKQLHSRDEITSDDLCRGFEEMQAQDGCEVYVADKDGCVVGTFVLYLLPNMTRRGRKAAILENIVVDSAHRKQGIGKSMLEYARDVAEKNGCYKLSLTSNAVRVEAHSFYEKCGMIKHGISFRCEL